MMRFCNLNSRGSRCAPGAICLLACLVTLTLAADGGSPAAEEQFRDRLAAGEFGPALDFVDGLTDRDQQVRLWDQIAAAQRRAGETRGAAETARRSAAPAAGAAAPLAGGASNANFTELMNLIQNTIEIESWSELGGKGTVAPFSTGVYVDPAGLLPSGMDVARCVTLTLTEHGGAAFIGRPDNLRHLGCQADRDGMAARQKRNATGALLLPLLPCDTDRP